MEAGKKHIIIDEETKKILEILSSLFCLEDLTRNSGNYGIIEKQATEGGSVQELRIVDFRVKTALNPRISVFEERIPELKSCFEKWDMLSNIEKAKELVEQDDAIKKSENVNRGVFDAYVAKIKETLQDFMSNPRRTNPE